MADLADLAQELEERERAEAIARRTRLDRMGSSICHNCGDEIPEERRRAVPGATKCIWCQAEAEGRSR